MQITLGLYQCHRRQENSKINNGQGGAGSNNSLDSQSSINPQRILHRDLKPGNIFLDANSNVKIGDFGLARVMNEESQFAYTHVGTPYYMSPEQINESNYNDKSDIWSLGCIIYETAALHPPFQAQNHLSLAMKIKAGKFERIPSRYSEELQRVVTWMLCQNPNERPNVDDLMNLPQISMRIREKKMQEVAHSIKKREEEMNRREEKMNERDSSIKEKEAQLSEKELLINELIKSSSTCASCGGELLKSLQKLASTMAGESSLAVSERMSIGSKLKESKMSAVSFSTNGYDGSSNKSKNSRTTQNAINKFKFTSDFKGYNDIQRVQQSARINEQTSNICYPEGMQASGTPVSA